jgi:hypothetical protein
MPSELLTPSDLVVEPSTLAAESPLVVTEASTPAVLPPRLVVPPELTVEPPVLAVDPSLLAVEPPVLATAASTPAVLPPDLAEAASPFPPCALSLLVEELEHAAKVSVADRTNARGQWT